MTAVGIILGSLAVLAMAVVAIRSAGREADRVDREMRARRGHERSKGDR